MQTDNSYVEFEKDIKELEKLLVKDAEGLQKLKGQRIAALEQVKDIEISWEAEKSKIHKITQDENFLNQERRQEEHNLTVKREELKDRIYQDKLAAFISEQPSFADALRSQVEKFSEHRMSGLSFEESRDSREIAEGILKRMGNRDFSLQTVDWRGAKGHYDKVLKNLCEAKLQNKQLTSQNAHFRFESILKCLRQQETALFS